MTIGSPQNEPLVALEVKMQGREQTTAQKRKSNTCSHAGVN